MENSRTENAKRNIILGYVNRIVTMALEFVVRYLFIKYLGEEMLGINEVYTNVIQFLSLAELGINNVVAYSLYSPLATQDTEKISALITFYKDVYNKIAFTVLVLGISIIPFLKYMVNVEISSSNLIKIYLLFLLDTVVSYLLVYKCILLSADQKGYIRSKYEMIFSILRTLLQIAALVLFKNIILYLFIKILCSIFLNYVTASKTTKLYPYINIKKELNSDEKKDIFNTIKSGFIYKLSSILLNSTDNLLISVMVGTVWVGYLANYVTIINGISAFYTILFTNLTAGVGNLVATETKEMKKEIFKIMLDVSSWLAVMFCTCFYCLSSEFVMLWVGEKFILSNSIVLAKSIMLAVSCSMQPLFIYREALGLYKKTKYVMVLSAIMNIIISIILGQYWGVAGILAASLISVFSTYYWYDPKILYKECFEEKWTPFLIYRAKDILYITFALVLFGYTSKFFIINSWKQWIAKALIIFLSVNLYCLICYRNTYTYKMIKSLFAKINKIAIWRNYK